MHKLLVRLQPLSILKPPQRKLWFTRTLQFAAIPASLSTYYLLTYKHSHQLFDLQDLPQENFTSKHKIEFLQALTYVLRCLELGFIFAPAIIALPLYLFDQTRDLWLSIFLKGVERAGIVWIKAFQYLSHRRDIIGEEMAAKFSVLRENSPTHPFQATQETFQRVYNCKVDDMFQKFNRNPVASGSVSQVYLAQLQGKQVAVKVRHPNAGNNLQRDIELLFAFSSFLSKFSRFFEIPITQQSLKRILREQLSFLRQKRNIDKFNEIVVDPHVRFPKTYPQSTNQILIQQFIQGRSIAYYERKSHGLSKLIASYGVKAYFSMLMKYNFIHADCHAGNILVRITPQNRVKQFFRSISEEVQAKLTALVIKYGLDSPFLKKLSDEHFEYERMVRADEGAGQKVEIVLIDVGMALRLTKQKKAYFQQFISQVIQGNAAQSAQWIYQISQVGGKQLQEGQNPQYLADLKSMFGRVSQTKLQAMQAMQVLRQMLKVIRKHNVKIDGQISVLLTNMLVLEAIAKNLDPNINILRCAVPYLRYS